jgi:hypothetical protein
VVTVGPMQSPMTGKRRLWPSVPRGAQPVGRKPAVELLGLCRAAGGRRDLMAGGGELRYEPPAERSGRSHHQYAHRFVSRVGPPCSPRGSSTGRVAADRAWINGRSANAVCTSASQIWEGIEAWRPAGAGTEDRATSGEQGGKRPAANRRRLIWLVVLAGSIVVTLTAVVGAFGMRTVLSGLHLGPRGMEVQFETEQTLEPLDARLPDHLGGFSRNDVRSPSEELPNNDLASILLGIAAYGPDPAHPALVLSVSRFPDDSNAARNGDAMAEGLIGGGSRSRVQ